MPDARTSVHPIELDDLDEAGQFLAANLSQEISASEWRRSVTQGWAQHPPNYGMKLVADGRIVGVFLAIYSDQYLYGRTERFCNPHSWCVLPEFRGDSLKLGVALIRQPGFHFCMLTPNPRVAAVFRFMKFKELDARIAVFPTFPFPTRMSAVDQPDAIRACLEGRALVDYECHAAFKWLRQFVVTESGTARCLLTFKLRRWKHFSCADIVGISDASQFARCLPAIRNYLFFKASALCARLEQRFIDVIPTLSCRVTRTQPKLFLSKTLADSDIRDLYSELVALDL